MLVGREYHDWLEKGLFFSLGVISRLNTSKKGILMRTFPPIYPLIIPVLDGYEDECSIWMSEP